MKSIAAALLLAPCLAFSQTPSTPTTNGNIQGKHQANNEIKQDWSNFKAKQKADREDFKQKMAEARKNFDQGQNGKSAADKNKALTAFKADQKSKWEDFNGRQKKNREDFLAKEKEKRAEQKSQKASGK
jgi:hypothetical protein